MAGKALRVAACAAAVVLGAFAIKRFCVVPYRCNAISGGLQERTFRAAQLEATTEGDILARRNLTQLRALHEGCENDLRWLMLYAANCRIIDDREEAIAAYTRALSLNRRPELYYNRGMTLLEMGKIDDAARDLATAAAFNPDVLNELDEATRERVQKAVPR